MCRRTVGRHVDRVPTDMSVDTSADTPSTSRPTVGRQIGRYVGRHSAGMLRLTVDGVSVDCRWYRSVVPGCLPEIAAVSLPIEDAEQDCIAYSRVLTGQDAAQTAANSKTYLFAVLLKGFPVCSREIAGFTEQGTAFTRPQSAILQNRD